MDFTYDEYIRLIHLLRSKGYTFSSYQNEKEINKTVIFRHDVDFSIDKALDMAKIENSLGVSSTYFVLLSTDFYNISSKSSNEKLKEIINLGHEIGLHFDEKKYNTNSINEFISNVKHEAKIMSLILDYEVKTVSMHRPSKEILEKNIKIDNIINSYSSYFFKDMKYISDSRMYWRVDPFSLIETGEFTKLHILTHPFWYSNSIETMEQKLKSFLRNSINDRYMSLTDNFRDLHNVIKIEEERV